MQENGEEDKRGCKRSNKHSKKTWIQDKDNKKD
jgi:hypothetical protein